MPEPPSLPYVCPACGARSWHPEDARHCYCARCGEYEETRALRRRLERLREPVTPASPRCPYCPEGRMRPPAPGRPRRWWVCDRCETNVPALSLFPEGRPDAPR